MSYSPTTELLQQEMSQRLLAIRMSAALYSRQNEGRKTQQLSDQTVDMVDDLIQKFNDLLLLMRLPADAASTGYNASIEQLSQAISRISGLPCEFDEQSQDILLRCDADRMFQLIYDSAIQLLLEPAKIRGIFLSLTNEDSPLLIIRGENGKKALNALANRLKNMPDICLERHKLEGLEALSLRLIPVAEAAHGTQ